jgi:hypothetical protein
MSMKIRGACEGKLRVWWMSNGERVRLWLSVAGIVACLAIVGRCDYEDAMRLSSRMDALAYPLTQPDAKTGRYPWDLNCSPRSIDAYSAEELGRIARARARLERVK